MSLIDERLAEFLDSLNEVITGLQSIKPDANESTCAATVDVEIVKSLLMEIRETLQKSELLSTSKLDDLYYALNGEVASVKRDRLRQNIDSFDYQAAIELLDEIYTGIKPHNGSHDVRETEDIDR